MPNPPTAVDTQNHNLLNTDDVRHFIYDRNVADNPLILDLMFSDDEINRAKRFMAMSFNAVTPYIYNLSPDYIPFADIMAMHGIVYHLYLSKIAQLSRADIDHEEGNVRVDINKRLIANLTALVKLHKDEFDKMAKQRKVTANMSAAFRNFDTRNCY